MVDRTKKRNKRRTGNRKRTRNKKGGARVTRRRTDNRAELEMCENNRHELDQRKADLEQDKANLINLMHGSISENDWINVGRIALRLTQKTVEIKRLQLETVRNEQKILNLTRAIAQGIPISDLEGAETLTDADIRNFSEDVPQP